MTMTTNQEEKYLASDNALCKQIKATLEIDSHLRLEIKSRFSSHFAHRMERENGL